MALIQLNTGGIAIINALSDFKELIQKAYGNQAASVFDEIAPYDDIEKDVDTVWNMIYDILEDTENELPEAHIEMLKKILNLLGKCNPVYYSPIY